MDFTRRLFISRWPVRPDLSEHSRLGYVRLRPRGWAAHHLERRQQKTASNLRVNIKTRQSIIFELWAVAFALSVGLLILLWNLNALF